MGVEVITEGTRDAYGRALKALAKEDPNVFAMDCDLGRSTRAFMITDVDPSRFIEMGISEQDMVSTAAGLASGGKCVFVNSFAVFLTGRAYDQIRQQVSLPRSNVKICGSSAGLTQGPDGATHQSITDINTMRGLPNMVVLSPADGGQAEQIVRFAHTIDGPVYIRLSRWETPPVVPSNLRFELGKFQQIRAGDDMAVVSTGPVLINVLSAAEALADRGIEVAVYNAPSIKPLDVEQVAELASGFKTIVSVEEHSIIGGLGSAIAEAISQMPRPAATARLERVGVQDCYGESGSAAELLAKHGLDVPGLIEAFAKAHGQIG